MNGLQVTSLFFIISGGVLCYPGQLMDEPSPQYQIRLQVLKIALAIDENWSAIWSEKLNPVPILAQPRPTFCMQLIPEENLKEPINTYQVIKDIVHNCSFSGLYIIHGMHLLSHSVKCFFQKHALAQLKTIKFFLNGITDEFKEYLRKLIKDYEMIADKLSVVGASLRIVFELVSFFDEILRGLPTDDSDLMTTCKNLKRRIITESEKLCATKGKMWYDKSNVRYLDIDVTQEFEAPPQKPEESSEKVPQSSGTSEFIVIRSPEFTPLQRVLNKAEELRIIMNKVFEGLLIREMPVEFWAEIFSDNILITETDMQKVETFEANLEGEVENDFNEFPWEAVTQVFE
ncbi:Hypothetical protein CINCED_3A018801 [Cinara cedri]|uniref:Uncharacterized protein n=1 Tax=Cinara cedri TaxID=506608 RepID=A0A5E4MLF1_9HEMI|nr:Hypothetical protein CINCED_3A018801 [Cinara cedri]